MCMSIDPAAVAVGFVSSFIELGVRSSNLPPSLLNVVHVSVGAAAVAVLVAVTVGTVVIGGGGSYRFFLHANKPAKTIAMTKAGVFIRPGRLLRPNRRRHRPLQEPLPPLLAWQTPPVGTLHKTAGQTTPAWQLCATH